MLQRKAYEVLARWKNSPSRRALLVTGARQIGKTFLIRQFGSENYDSVLELNFLLDDRATQVFSGASSPDDIIRRLTLMSERRLVPGKSLVFLDEVQAFPEAVSLIKGLVDEGRFDYILSGSLLGVELRDIRSNPVGYVQTLEMFPLDFEEFCWAKGVPQDFFAYLDNCKREASPVDAPVHARMMSLFYEYLVVGGMPDAVATYVASNDISLVRDIQEGVKAWYRTDISKYCPDSDKLKAKDAFDLIPAELNNPNKRFILKDLNEGARFRGYEDAFLWLTRANVALAAFNVTEPAMPLLLNKERRLFKLFQSDVGLLASSFSRKVALSLLDGDNEANYGSAFENVVAQELAAHGFPLYYFSNKKLGELDFVIETRDGEVIPLEVKSGKAYKRHRALDAALNVENWHLERGFVLGPGNLERNGKVVYLPVYMASLFHND